MSAIDQAVNDFNIGFFSTTLNAKDSMDLNSPISPKYDDFEGKLTLVSSEAITPEEQSMELDGVKFVEEKGSGEVNAIPAKLTVYGHFQETFLDENGNWDKEAESKAYKEKELAYKKDVISDWMKEKGYDLQNNAALMKALLEKEG